MLSSYRRYVVSALIGFGLAGPMVGLGLWFNVAHLADIVAGSDRSALMLLVLWSVNGLVLSAVQFGLSGADVTDDEDDDGPGGGLRHYELRPIPVRRDQDRRG